MSEAKQRQVRLSAIGFDDRSQESFRIAFKGPGRGKAVLVDDNKADGGIVNMDSAGAKALWANYRERNPNKPTIILGVTDPGIVGALFVKKPATIDQMLEAVDRLISDLGHEEPVAQADERPSFRLTASDQAAIDRQRDDGKGQVIASANSAKKAPVAVAATTAAAKNVKLSPFYNPRDYMQSEIHSAIEYSLKSQVAVELWIMAGDEQWGKIIFLPGLKKVLTSFTDNELKQHCSTPLALVTHKLYRRKPKDTQELEDRVAREQRGCRYESFLWKIALYTSLGRLPQGTNLSSNMHLKQWPNLTRLYPLGGSMRIATLLVDQPRSLPVIAKVLKMPVGRVFSFYSAASAIGIVESSEPVALNIAKTIEPKKHRDHTLFGRILKRLRNGESEFEAYA
jgi:hypothetical protein